MDLKLILILVGNLVVTSYRSVPSQTDSSPFITSTSEHVVPTGVAVSRDLLCGACRKLHKRCKHPEYPYRLHYGDWLYAEELGFLRINDCMGSYTAQRVNGKIRHITIVHQIDIWVKTYSEEKHINISNKNIYKVVTKNGGTYEQKR